MTGRLRWTVSVGGRILDVGTVPALEGCAEQVALDALSDYSGRHGIPRWDMSALTCTVALDGWPLVVLAMADGRDW